MANVKKQLKAKTPTTSKQPKLTECALRGKLAPDANTSMTEQPDPAHGEPAATGVDPPRPEHISGGEITKGTTLDQIMTMLIELKAEMASIKTEIKSEYNTRFDQIYAEMKEMRGELGVSEQRVSETEQRISDNADELTELKAEVKSLRAENNMMKSKLLDLESRGRRANLKLHGIPESEEKGEDTEDFLERIIPKILTGSRTPLPNFTIERAHRLGQRRGEADPPRPLIMRFLNHRDKERVLQAARKKRELFYGEKRVYFTPDLAEGVRQQRAEFRHICEELKKKNLRFGFAFPAILLVTFESKKYTFKTPKEADELIKKIRSMEK